MSIEFTAAANHVMTLADHEARALKHQYLGTEHILLGLIREGSVVASDVLKALGIGADQIRHEIEKLVQPGPREIPTGALPLTPRARRVISVAGDEVRLMAIHSIGPEHLLLGLYREPDGVAGQALRNLGLQIGQLVSEVFRVRLEQMKIVERVVRPLPAGTPWKRKTREELLAHLTAIYEEEKQRTGDSAAALEAAARRFGDPAELSDELKVSLPWSERRTHYLEQWFSWRAPETAVRFMFRQSMQLFVFLAIGCSLIVGATALLVGWNAGMWQLVRSTAAFVAITPTANFLLGVLYYKTRDALYGPIWASKSWGRAILFTALSAAATFAVGVAFIALSTWDRARVVEWLLPAGCIALVIAAAEFVLARKRGLTEIRDTLWALLNLNGTAESRGPIAD